MNYPRCLPPPLAAGYELESPDDLLRSEMDGGLARTRPRAGIVPRKVVAHWLVTGLPLTLIAPKILVLSLTKRSCLRLISNCTALPLVLSFSPPSLIRRDEFI